MPLTGLFAERLKTLRKQAELSQPQLAARSGVAVGTIRQFEYGLREPTYGTLLKLAAGLGVSLAAFDQNGDAAPSRPAKRKRPKR
jgi:transcriptional regulator with XRE-family HTH domain